MANEPTLIFQGVCRNDRLVGVINSSDLIEGFDRKVCIPPYQRARVEKKVKISELKQIYKEDREMDVVKLNVREGDLREMASGKTKIIGQYYVIDGQQRILALIDSKVKDLDIPVQIWMGLTYDEELRLFNQFNAKPTKLTVADMIKSYNSPLSDLVRRVLKSRMYPIRMSLNQATKGLTVTSYSTLLCLVHKKMVDGVRRTHCPSSTSLKSFMEDSRPSEAEMRTIEISMRRILQAYVDVFGDYSHGTLVYKRPFFLAWTHIMVDQFLQPGGTIDFGPFKAKFNRVQSLRTNSVVMEYAQDNSGYGHQRLYDFFVKKHFNRGMKNHRMDSVMDHSVHQLPIEPEEDQE